MKYIPLTRGKEAIIDDDCLDLISPYKWRYAKLKTTEYATTGKGSLRMHRLIIGAKPDEEVDHINGSGLDNRRINLRKCTRAQNVRNTPKRNDTLNAYKGVHYMKHRGKWQARIQINKKRINKGYFNTQVEAAHAYDDLAREHFGEYARLNFPLDTDKQVGG